MYNYAVIGENNIVEVFWIEESPLSPEDFPFAIPVDEADIRWVQRKKWDAEAQQFIDVDVSEVTMNVQDSSSHTHFDSNGNRHWLDDYINNLASGGSVETATVSEVETYLSI